MANWVLYELNHWFSHQKTTCEVARSDEAAAEDASVQLNCTYERWYCNVMYCSSCLPESAVLSPKLAMSVSKGNMAWACPVCWEEGLKDVE